MIRGEEGSVDIDGMGLCVGLIAWVARVCSYVFICYLHSVGCNDVLINYLDREA